MMSRMVGSVLTLVILLFSVVGAAAQTYTQMQWGMNKGVTPYAFGANINGAWSNLGTVSSAGVWQIPATNLSGTLPAGRLPAFSGECSSSAGSAALSCPRIWRGSVAVEAYGADPTGSTSSDAALDAAIAAAGGGCVTFGAGNFLFNNAHSYNEPICIIGVGKGTGPGNSSHSYDHTTQMIINSKTNILFNVVNEVGSRFEGFRCNTDVAVRPATTNGCIKLSASGGVNVASPIINNVGTTTVARPIQLVAPAWPVITDNYFDDWAGSVETDAAIYCSTTPAREGSCGFISHNYFFGGAASGPVLYSEVGYTDFHDNEALAVGTVIRFKYKNNAAGFTKIHDNTIENFGFSGQIGVIIQTGDGSEAAYVMIQNNEFFPTYSPVSTIFIEDYASSPTWLNDVIISGNTLRQNSAAGASIIRVGAGKNVQITNNVIREEGSNSPFGININGTATSAGLVSPILVKDNTLTGVYTNKYAFTTATNIVWSDMTGSTVGAGGSQLPSNAGVGSEAVVTDGAAALAWGANIAGGGTDKYKVFYNGANWTVQAK